MQINITNGIVSQILQTLTPTSEHILANGNYIVDTNDDYILAMEA